MGFRSFEYLRERLGGTRGSSGHDVRDSSHLVFYSEHRLWSRQIGGSACLLVRYLL